MRRILALVAVAILGFAVVRAQPPPAPSAPDFAIPELEDPGEAVGRTAAWYCPWVAAGAIRDAGIGLVSEPPSEAVVTLPSPIPG
ncbi:MAG TPA: hypothetical protein ENK55_02575, partial [Actinobacteria bacterium]|nr:hypothetical protein [Actinomycetota bacterium]